VSVEYIFSEVERIVRKYRTRNPFELLGAIGAVTHFSYAYNRDGLKGYSTIVNRVMYAVINGNMGEHEQKVTAGHEAGHLVLHRSVIMSSPVKMMKDFNLFDNSGRYEWEANTFLADFMVSDKAVMEVVSDEGRDYFSAARELYMPPPLFAFKLDSMMKRGYDVRSPVNLDSRFLANSSMWMY
jgi:Zn-dependent peptidase ImmA (M78 family)